MNQLFDPAKTPKADEFGFMWHPDMDALLPCEDSTDEQATAAAKALGWEYKSVNWEEDEDPNGNISAWHPKPPDGDGWRLVAMYNNVEGDYYACFVRPDPALPKPEARPEREGK